MEIDSIEAKGYSDKILKHWQSVLHFDATIPDDKNYKKFIKKEDFVWTVLAVVCEKVETDFIAETLSSRIRLRKNATICLRSHEKNCLIKLYREHLFEAKYSRKKAVYEGLHPHFKTDEEAKLFVDINFERKRRNMICRRIRMTRKANLQDFNFFVTFTYDDKLHVFYAVDGFGNRSDTCYMYMSIDVPEATIVKSDNSHKVCVIWTANNCYATLNGKSYTSGTWIEQEGEYTFVITNDANRSTTYKFTVDHYYARYSMVAPTCTQKGYTIYKCTGCGDSYDGDFIEAKGHDYESKIVKPTCTAQGYTRYTCKTCGNTYTDNFVEAEGHRYGEWTTVKEPTCVDLGKDERKCSVCSYVDEKDIDALGHSYKDIVVDPSCTERGNTIHECERCGHTYTDSYTDATGHDFGEWTSLTKPACTASGVEQRKCTSCPQTETKIVSPLGHNYKAEIVEPTCLEQGYTTHICSRCGTGYNDTFVSPLGHDYEEIEVAPTCTEEGYRGKKCRRCEDCVKTEILKAVGHKFTDSYFIATCEDEGYTLHTCLSCGNEYKDNIVPATGHDYETEVVREPHCETEGERKFHCTKCEKEYYSDIPATGHNYELTGTEEVNGENIRTYVCTNCGAITTQNMGEQYEQVSSYIGYLFGQYQPYKRCYYRELLKLNYRIALSNDNKRLTGFHPRAFCYKEKMNMDCL